MLKYEPLLLPKHKIQPFVTGISLPKVYRQFVFMLFRNSL